MATGEEGMGHFLRYQGQPYLDILFSEERKRREKVHFSCLVTIEIGKREDQKVGPTSFSFLLSTAKKVKRKTLIFLCFL
jgi:hypothetical protein